jgi:hypothetical protein
MSRFIEAGRILLATLLGTLLGTLREIFDEAAYARFLSRTKMASSAIAYAAFREEFEEAKTRRPKCC